MIKIGSETTAHCSRISRIKFTNRFIAKLRIGLTGYYQKQKQKYKIEVRYFFHRYNIEKRNEIAY